MGTGSRERAEGSGRRSSRTGSAKADGATGRRGRAVSAARSPTIVEGTPDQRRGPSGDQGGGPARINAADPPRALGETDGQGHLTRTGRLTRRGKAVSADRSPTIVEADRPPISDADRQAIAEAGLRAISAADRGAIAEADFQVRLTKAGRRARPGRSRTETSSGRKAIGRSGRRGETTIARAAIGKLDLQAIETRGRQAAVERRPERSRRTARGAKPAGAAEGKLERQTAPGSMARCAAREAARRQTRRRLGRAPLQRAGRLRARTDERA